ncbi:MAG: hypothetical protein KDB21_15690 [Acidimicrobiales bacterium]|nr:hypothetical protein [Acidimicrobiales bacterium]
MSFDQATMWEALEKRLAETDNPRHRAMLEVGIEHAKAEADRSVERLMATLVEDPAYHFWVRGRDIGPKGADGVRAYYEQFVGSGGAVFESPKERVVVDDHNVVSEAEVSNYVPGKVAAARGYTVPDDSGHYLVRFRNIVFFVFGEDPTRAIGEDSVTSMDPDAWERVADADLPEAYTHYLAELG